MPNYKITITPSTSAHTLMSYINSIPSLATSLTISFQHAPDAPQYYDIHGLPYKMGGSPAPIEIRELLRTGIPQRITSIHCVIGYAMNIEDIRETLLSFSTHPRTLSLDIGSFAVNRSLDSFIETLKTFPPIDYIRLGGGFNNFPIPKVKELFDCLVTLGIYSIDFSDDKIPLEVLRQIPPTISEVSFPRSRLKVEEVASLAQSMPYVRIVNLIDRSFSSMAFIKAILANRKRPSLERFRSYMEEQIAQTMGAPKEIASYLHKTSKKSQVMDINEESAISIKANSPIEFIGLTPAQDAELQKALKSWNQYHTLTISADLVARYTENPFVVALDSVPTDTTFLTVIIEQYPNPIVTPKELIDTVLASLSPTISRIHCVVPYHLYEGTTQRLSITRIKEFMSALALGNRTLSLDISTTLTSLFTPSFLEERVDYSKYLASDEYLHYLVEGLRSFPSMKYIKLGNGNLNCFSRDKIQELFNCCAALGVHSIDFSATNFSIRPFTVPVHMLPPSINEVTFDLMSLRGVDVKSLLQTMPHATFINLMHVFRKIRPIGLDESEKALLGTFIEHIGRDYITLHQKLAGIYPHALVHLIMNYVMEEPKKAEIMDMTVAPYKYEYGIQVSARYITSSIGFLSSNKVTEPTAFERGRDRASRILPEASSRESTIKFLHGISEASALTTESNRPPELPTPTDAGAPSISSFASRSLVLNSEVSSPARPPEASQSLTTSLVAHDSLASLPRWMPTMFLQPSMPSQAPESTSSRPDKGL